MGHGDTEPQGVRPEPLTPLNPGCLRRGRAVGATQWGGKASPLPARDVCVLTEPSVGLQIGAATTEHGVQSL